MKTRTVFIMVLVVVTLAGLNVYQYFGSRTQLSDEEVVDRFHEVFVKSKGLLKNKWFGIATLQHPFDVWITQEIIFGVRPDVIVETGTFRGGSAVLWATILEHANPEGRVITIDIEDIRSKAAQQLPVWQRRVEFLKGSSTDPEIVSEVEKRAKGKKVLVILDSAHRKGHVLRELRAYSPLVSVGSYLIVQDTHLGDRIPFWYAPKKSWWTPGPLKAVEEFMATTEQYAIDSSRERLLATNNRSGFLKRIR